MSTRGLAVFDIDGTIAVKGVLPESVVKGLHHIQKIGYATTVSTGRSYRRLRDALGENFETVISPDALIVAEHGTKILDREGGIVEADYFSPAETEHFVDFVRANEEILTFCTYALPEPDALLELWAKKPEDVDKLKEKRGSFANVFHCSYADLKKRMHGQKITHTLAKLEDFVVVENLKLKFTRSNMNLIFMDTYMQFIGSFSDKAKAIAYLERHHGISVENMLLAGNGINDADMLDLDAGQRIVVGPDETANVVIGHLKNQKNIIRVESPAALGEYLQSLT